MSKRGVQAPCSYGQGKGIVFDWDPDNKAGLCVCEVATCSVDWRNRVTAAFPQGPNNPYTAYASLPDGIVQPRDIRPIALLL